MLRASPATPLIGILVHPLRRCHHRRSLRPNTLILDWVRRFILHHPSGHRSPKTMPGRLPASPTDAHFSGAMAVAFLWQIWPFGPVLPVMPSHKSFASNKLLQDSYLHTVEAVGSNPAVPTIKSITYKRDLGTQQKAWEQMGTLDAQLRSDERLSVSLCRCYCLGVFRQGHRRR